MINGVGQTGDNAWHSLKHTSDCVCYYCNKPITYLCLFLFYIPCYFRFFHPEKIHFFLNNLLLVDIKNIVDNHKNERL